jgi:hypothetical protein
MEVQINLDNLRQKKLFVATPMYGGQCTGQFTSSFATLVSKAKDFGIHFQHYFMFNESLIQRARNYCVDEFMRSDCTHLMFIDADIGFSPDDIMIMLNMMDEDSGYDVLCGPYPKKCISWEKIKLAVDKGAADEDPNNLENYVGDFVINLDNAGQTNVSLDQPFQIAEGGTGFMMIHRKTFEKYRDATPQLSYKPDHIRSEHFQGNREIHAYFDCVIDPESKRYLSEDYFFCQETRKAGMKVWMCPFMKLSHTGTYTFGGTLGHLASIQADPTAGGVKKV